MTSLALIVNRRAYEGWRSVSVTRTMRAAAGSFSLEISDRWTGQEQAWPIVEEDNCRVEMGGRTVIDGWVGSRSQSIDASTRAFSVSGKDRAGVLVECSSLLDRWSFKQTNALEIASTVAAQYGIDVALGDGVPFPPVVRKLVVNVGESAFDVIVRAAQTAGLMVISDGRGGIQLARVGTARADSLVEGRNVLAASVEYQAADRYARYVVFAQRPGDDNASGNELSVRAEATDEGVERGDRTLVVRAPRAMNRRDAKTFADWTARVTAAQSESVNVTVQGWQQTSGALWPINARTSVSIPSIGVDGEMLIAEANHTLSPAGELTNLTLVRPDAFEPDSSAVVRATGATWKKRRGTE